MYWLIGLMGVGKSTVGRLAAERLGLPFVDTDIVVESRSGATVPEIFSNQGESEFRRLERSAFQSLTGESGVYSAGGGAPMDPQNADVIRAGESIVWLECDVPTLVERLNGDSSRPLLGQNPASTLRKLLASRAETYSSIATSRIDTSESNIDDVVEQLVALWSG